MITIKNKMGKDCEVKILCGEDGIKSVVITKAEDDELSEDDSSDEEDSSEDEDTGEIHEIMLHGSKVWYIKITNIEDKACNSERLFTKESDMLLSIREYFLKLSHNDMDVTKLLDIEEIEDANMYICDNHRTKEGNLPLYEIDAHELKFETFCMP